MGSTSKTTTFAKNKEVVKKKKDFVFFQSKDKLHSSSESHVSLTINARFVSASLTLTENLFPNKSLIEMAIGAIVLLNSS